MQAYDINDNYDENQKMISFLSGKCGATSSSTATTAGTTSSSITPPLNDDNEFRSPLGAKIGGRPLSPHSLKTHNISSSSTATAGTTSSASCSQFAWRESKEVKRVKMEAKILYQERLQNRIKKMHHSSSATTQASSNLSRVEFAKQNAHRLKINRLNKSTDELHKKKKW
jgi:hypothetical protein